MKKPDTPFWWTINHRYGLYFIRELTGPIIALYFLCFIFFGIFDKDFKFFNSAFFQVSTLITLVASVIHSLTWLSVTTQITPLPLTKTQQRILFVVFLVAWIAVSYFIYKYLYVD